MPATSAITRRKGAQSRRIPWKYISFVVGTVFLVFFFLYARALNDVVYHEKQRFAKQATGMNNHHNQAALGPKNILIFSIEALGDVKIKLREDLSKKSVDYIRQIIATGECPRCSFYRAEEHGILQGIIKNPNIKQDELIEVTKGDCPADLQDSKWKDNCHGPIMTHGMVGWAGGKTGPDFFIDWYQKEAKFWGAQHTVWGEVVDEESSRVIDEIWELPVHKKGLTYLVEPVKFKMSLTAEE